MNESNLNTVICTICGDIIMHSFLKTHMQYVHPLDTTNAQLDHSNNSVSKSRKVKSTKKKKVNSPTRKPAKKSPQKVTFIFKSYAPSLSSKEYSSLRQEPPLKCILCGELIPHGKLQSHKEQVHGEKQNGSANGYSRFTNPWVSFVQGGSPGLRKK